MARILIVDDETLIREWLEMCIIEYGIEKSNILQANNGENAYTIVKELNPDIIISDITMPKMDGLEFIRNVRKINENVHIVILTCHEDFDFARYAVKYNVFDYLLKNELNKEDVIQLLREIGNRLSTQVNKKIDNLDLIIRGQYLRSIVNSEEKELISPKELLDYKIYIENEAFISITFTYDIEVINYLEFDKKEYLKNPIVFINNTSDVVLIANLLGKENEFPHIINRLIGEIKEYCGENTNVGYSKIYYSTQDLVHAINESIAMREYLFFSPNNLDNFKVKDSKDIKEVKVNIINYKNEIIDNFNTLGKEEAMALSEKLFKYIKSERIFETRFIKRIFTEIVEIVYDQLNEENINIEGHLKNINNAANINELRDFVIGFFNLVRSKENISECVSRAIQYINNNYYKSISLTDLAKDAFLSEEYFSRLFKKEVGTNYSKYITDLRMNKAKKMVRSMKMNINEIAMMVGIPNPSYFSSMFKKYFGTSPSDMRKEITDNNKK
ncbi:MAG: response regulator [Firmicutes bacterium]|nr:response regulator [Bacillota bacterium]